MITYSKDEIRQILCRYHNLDGAEELSGRTGTKDISIGQVREGSWGHKKLSSAALDYLYNGGELCVADKKGTQKYFDLTERVIRDEDLKSDSNPSMFLK